MQAFEQQMKARGFSQQDIDFNGLYVAGRDELKSLLGFRISHAGIVIPYHYCEGAYFRVRPFGGDAKYLSPRSELGRPIAYLPRRAGGDWEDIRADIKRPILITEGEFKATDLC